jgi:hypothetical protein
MLGEVVVIKRMRTCECLRFNMQVARSSFIAILPLGLVSELARIVLVSANVAPVATLKRAAIASLSAIKHSSPGRYGSAGLLRRRLRHR